MIFGKLRVRIVIITLSMLFSHNVLSQGVSNPQFSDYQVEVSKGPFENKIFINKEQEWYSAQWKRNMEKQLNSPINFAGHFRVYTEFGGHGKECLRDNWVCGWVIDKLTGKIVATLPVDDNGSNHYADVADNGTPVGLPFEMDAYKNSSMIAITGQSIPLKKGMDDSPVCKTALFNFKGDKYIKLTESIEGCNLE